MNRKAYIGRINKVIRHIEDHLDGDLSLVLAFGLEDGRVRLHDPAGYPFASLPVGDLIEAGKTCRLQYGLYPRDLVCHCWAEPVRTRIPSSKEVYREAVRYFREVYLEMDRDVVKHNMKTGPDAYDALRRHILGGEIGPALQSHLIHFAFQLSARRSLDYSRFFRDENPELSELKLKQAELFGNCHCLAVRGDWRAVGEELPRLGETERRFRELLFRE